LAGFSPQRTQSFDDPLSGRRPKAEESMVGQIVTSGAFKSMLRSAATVVGRDITRSLFGTARRRR
jgi:uncharacterized protein